MDDYKDTQAVIENMARVKRVMNSHKGAIEEESYEVLIKMLFDEWEELEHAINAESSLIHVIEEAADIYNFLMAVVHKKVIEYRGRKNADT